jgi:hypothetical protein
LGKKGSAPAEYEVKIGHCVAVKAWSAWRMPFGGIICPVFWCWLYVPLSGQKHMVATWIENYEVDKTWLEVRSLCPNAELHKMLAKGI